ncbi:hypothetical protein E2C01_014405 [Portunus trituberculatus]|uniref:Uncharacterized protein n=1 Tax=Portunus trituberculatus TaxID=210409 RepID=A0A5B7DJ32_PORTR|nr:hypothetical protein [Portunus trituberculatus]
MYYKSREINTGPSLTHDGEVHGAGCGGRGGHLAVVLAGVPRQCVLDAQHPVPLGGLWHRLEPVVASVGLRAHRQYVQVPVPDPRHLQPGETPISPVVHEVVTANWEDVARVASLLQTNQWAGFCSYVICLAAISRLANVRRRLPAAFSASSALPERKEKNISPFSSRSIAEGEVHLGPCAMTNFASWTERDVAYDDIVEREYFQTGKDSKKRNTKIDKQKDETVEERERKTRQQKKS